MTIDSAASPAPGVLDVVVPARDRARVWWDRARLRAIASRVATVVVALGLLFGAVVGTLVVFHHIANPPASPTWEHRDTGIRLSFEYGRDPITRVRNIDLCELGGGAGYAECGSLVGTANGAGPAAATSQDRPRVLSAYLAADLSGPSGKQFPASKVTVEALNVGQSSLQVSVTVDPSDGLGVTPGYFDGAVVVERLGDAEPIVTPVRVEMRDRGGWLTRGVMITLFAGAALGALLKWMNDTFTPVADMRRRYVRFNRSLGWNRSHLPVAVDRQLTEVADAVNAFDVTGVKETLDELGAAHDDLGRFVVGLERLAGELDQQRHWAKQMDKHSAGFAREILVIEEDLLDDFRHGDWPWAERSDAEQLFAKLGIAETNFRSITRSMRTLAADPSSDAARTMVRSLAAHLERVGGDALADVEALATVEPVPAPTSARRTRSNEPKPLPRLTPKRPRPGAREMLLDHAYLLLSVVGAALTVFVGYQSQFLNDPGFDAGASDFLLLAGWSLGLQVAGTTVVQVLGQLTTRPV